ncbi:MAG: PIN domain-containing protein [Thermodesulfobacteriota bacterium]|jgi:predicted nucleic acid-binding protein
MSDNVFFDTNILVYANDTSEPAKKQVARKLIKDALLNKTAVISIQVLSEFWVTVTQKIQTPLPETVAEKQIELFEIMEIVNLDLLLFKSALKLKKMNRLSYWDSLIVAAANYSDCKILYSEDLNNGQQISNTTIMNPFV